MRRLVFSLTIIHVFVHACETCYGHSSIALARRMGEICNLELGNESMGQHKESRVDIRIFLDHLLLGS